MGNQPMVRQRPGSETRPARAEWWIVPEPLLARILQRRHEDGAHRWSFEKIGAHVGRTGAAIRKVCRGETLQPDIEVVDGLAALLHLDRSEFTAGQLPETAASRERGIAQRHLAWLDEALVDGLDRVADPTAQSVLDNGIRVHIAAARHRSTPPTQVREAWGLDHDKLETAIRRASKHDPHRLRSNAAIGRSVGASEASISKMRRGEVAQPDLVVLHRLAELVTAPIDEVTTGDVPRIVTAADIRPAPIRCAWISNDNRTNLATMTDPEQRAIVQRGIRVLLEAEALKELTSCLTRYTDRQQ